VKKFESSDESDSDSDVEEGENFKKKMLRRLESTTVSVKEGGEAGESPSRQASQEFDNDEDDDVYDEQEEVETGKVTI